MTLLRERMLEDLRLRGLSCKTQAADVGAVRQLAAHYHKPPDQITEDELRQDFLYLTDVKHAAPSTLSIALSGIKFFYQHTLRRDGPTLVLVRPPREKKLPGGLSVAEVESVLRWVPQVRYRLCLSTRYACGLRLQEGVHRQVGDREGERRLVHVRHGKGNKERSVPLPSRLLDELRTYWRSHRHPVWLFPSVHQTPPHPDRPMDVSGVQRAFRAALRESGVAKPATGHTRRHAYATHLLEAGVNWRIIQAYLGHTSPTTTALYTHLTRPTEARVLDTLNPVVAALGA
ncbi:MAG: tyrosine-type recombinase/integrase [Anaerolineales bacterium]